MCDLKNQVYLIGEKVSGVMRADTEKGKVYLIDISEIDSNETETELLPVSIPKDLALGFESRIYADNSTVGVIGKLIRDSKLGVYVSAEKIVILGNGEQHD